MFKKFENDARYIEIEEADTCVFYDTWLQNYIHVTESSAIIIPL